MKLKKNSIALICIVFIFSGFTQSSIDYKPKALIKTLQKSGITDVSAIKECALPDSVSMLNACQGKFFRIENNAVNQLKYIYVGRVNSCRAGGCSLPGNESPDVNSEYFDYYILFDEDKKVQTVNIYNYQATHGQEVTARGWLKQFIGHDGSEPLRVDKNIDAISGATISVYALTLDIEMKLELLKCI